jgi:uncharacterized membrane protein YheB (UPF0754 family)
MCRITVIDALWNDWVTWLIPVIAAIVGWGTNVLAVQMMFYPTDFVGIKPWIGWQGIVPANAVGLAARSTDIITTKLLNLRELFQNFDAKGFTSHLDGVIDDITDQVITESAAKYGGDMWAKMNDTVRGQIHAMLRAEIHAVTIQILADLGEQIEDVINLKDIVVETAHRDRKLMGQMFQTVGSEEFKFIKHSGAYFGLAFGILQMLVWVIYPVWWVLPFFGFLVGYATNLLAIKLIFEPAEPKKFGPWTIQGLFHKRQEPVAREFSTMVSRDILNPDNMVQKMVTGNTGAAFFAIVDKHIGALLERYKKNPMTAALVPADKWDEIGEEVFARVRDELPKKGGFLHIFTERAIDICGELMERMVKLDSKSFEGILRPPFQKDEWKLVVVGAVLGGAAGVLQVIYLFGDTIG